ncbi:MAG: Lrp/AsnC family transcriptional regulator [Rhodospirillaceae bacterium]|nr:Lrp/AsnC family transcriptional regulator [Rhodospirillaceae bacterium]
MIMIEFDEIDSRIIAKLQSDGRVPVVELAEHAHLSPTACHKRLKRLEDAGVISGYSAVLSTRNLGYQIEAFIFVTIERQVKSAADAFKSEVEKLNGVRACYLLSGETDFLVHIVAADLDAYNKIVLNQLMTLPGARSVRTSFVLDKIHSVPPLVPPAAS